MLYYLLSYGCIKLSMAYIVAAYYDMLCHVELCHVIVGVLG